MCLQFSASNWTIFHQSNSRSPVIFFKWMSSLEMDRGGSFISNYYADLFLLSNLLFAKILFKKRIVFVSYWQWTNNTFPKMPSSDIHLFLGVPICQALPSTQHWWFHIVSSGRPIFVLLKWLIKLLQTSDNMCNNYSIIISEPPIHHTIRILIKLLRNHWTVFSE